MDHTLRALEAHEALAGWAQFFGAMLALSVTYFTAFAPVWARKRRLYAEANRLLMHGYEVIESYHRTSAHFLPFKLSLRQASLTMTVAMEEMGRFPVYELDKNFGPLSFARRLMTMRMTVGAVQLLIDATAEEIGDRTATDEERDILREFIGERLAMAHNLLMGVAMQRPEWPSQGQPT